MPRSIEEWAKERNRDRSGGSVGSSIVSAVGGKTGDGSVSGSIIGAVGGQSGGSVGGSIAGAIQQQTGQSGGQGSPRSIEEWAQEQQGSRPQTLDDGQRIYEQRKQAQANADPWTPTLKWLGGIAQQAEQARNGLQVQVDPTETYSAWEDVKDAWEASRKANRAADYAGRDKLIKEYNAALHEMGAQRHTPEPEVQQRYEQARDRLYEQERIHGNIGLNANGELQTMSYSFGEGVGNVIGGTMGRVIGGVGSAATWLGEAAARSEYAKSAANLREMAAFYAMTGNDNASEGAYRMADTLTQRAAQRGNLDEFGGAYDFFDKQAAAGNRLVQAAKENQRPVVQMGVDVGSTALEMGFDAVSGSPLVSMGVRVFGGSSQEAREAGAGFLQQGAYGAASASIEVMTETIGGLKLYGGGQLDEVLEPALREIAGTPSGYALLRAMYTMVQEGNEEVLSDLLQPLAQSIYNGQSVGENYSELQLKDILYDWLLGAASAFGGAVVESGGYAQDYRALTEMQQDLNAQGVETGRMTDEQLRQAYTLDKAGVNVAGLQSAENRAVGGETIGEAYDNMTQEQRVAALVNMLAAQTQRSGQTQTPTDNITRETAQEILRESLGEREAESAERILDLGSESNLREQAIAYHTIATEYGQTEGRSVEDALRSNVRGALNDTQVQHAYAYGESLRKSGQTVGVNGQTTEQGAQTAKPVRRAGLVTAGTFADGNTTYKAADLSKADARDLRILNDIAKAQGVDFVLYESELGEADAEGRRSYIGANGAYRNGVVYLDINAGLSGERTEGGKTYSIGQRALLVTAAHELTHHLEHSNAAMYRQLRSFVTERLGGSDSFISYVREAMAREDIGVEAASREVVARACEEVLLDENAIRELQGKKPGLWEQIKEWVKEFVKKFQSPSGEAVEMRQYADELRRLWLDTALETPTDLRGDIVPANAPAVDPASAPEETFTASGANGQQYSLRSMSHDIAEGKMFSDLRQYCGWTQEQTDTLKKNLQGLVQYMSRYAGIVDMNESYDKGNRPYSAYKPNSDPLYTISLDFSTLCRKRLLTQYIMEQLQLQLTDAKTGKPGRILTAEEQMAIRDMLEDYAKQEKALKVACAMCYVEAARLKAPAQMERIIGDMGSVMIDYYAKQSDLFKGQTRSAQNRWKVEHGYSATDTKAAMTNKDRSAFNKFSKEFRASYTPTAAEMEVVERARNLPRTAFLSAENLTRLYTDEQTRDIYKAYTNKLRESTHSKGLETDIPYYYGDSAEAVSDTFIRNVVRENGMRFSSWSDFQMKHVLDMMTAVIELSTRKCSMHGYTKFLEAVRLFGRTGMMFNMSGVPAGNGFTADGQLAFSKTESVLVYGENGEYDAIRARREFPETAGLQCIGISRAHILALLDSDIIDYIIPYHTSGLNAKLRKMAGINNWDDFQGFQNATVDKSIEQGNCPNDIWHKEPVFSEFFAAAKDPANGYKEGEAGIDTMRRAAEQYKQMCRERGLRPKFSWANSKVDANFSDHPDYWKLLIDRKMINQETGKLIEQKPVEPNFDFAEIKRAVDEEVAGYDAELEDKALAYVKEHLDELPGRVKDLKAKGSQNAHEAQRPTTLDRHMLDMQNGLYAAEASGLRNPSVTTRVESKNATETEYNGKITQHSLRGVEPVEPKSDAWKRGFTAEEVRRKYAGFRKSDAKNEYVEDSGKSYKERKADRIRLAQREKAGKRGNGTQRANTAPTYDRLYDTLEHEGFKGTILDASSGLGIGTDHGIQRGFDVEDIEPFYGEGYRPIFSDYSRLNKQYDVVISSAVINVLTQDDSDAMVAAIGNALKPGGRAFITVRSASSVDGSLKGGESKRLSQNAHEWVVPGSDNYQRGFETDELRAYLEDVLGPGFTVESSPKFYDKATDKWQKWGDTSAIVTRKNAAPAMQASAQAAEAERQTGTDTTQHSVRSDAMTDREILMLAEAYGEGQTELSQFRDAMARYQDYDEAAQEHLQKLSELQTERKTVTDMRTSMGEITPQEKQQRLDALDKQIASERREADKAEQNAARALDRVTQLEKGRALQDILVKERAAQRQRTRAQVNESTRRRDTRRKVEKLAKELQHRVLKPSEKRYIPADLMKQTVDVLQAINLDSSRPGTKSGEALRARLLELQERYRQLETDETYQGATYDPIVAEMLQNMVQAIGSTPVNKMTAAQLESVYDTLRAMTHVIQTGVKVKLAGEERDAWEVAHDMTRETRSVNKPKDSLMSDWVNVQLSAARMFHRLGNYTKNSAWMKVYRMLNDGQLKMSLIEMEGAQIFAHLIGKENEKAYRELNSYKEKDLVDVGLVDENGNSIKISRGMMVSLYMHLLNEQNASHVARGGLTIPELKGYYTGADDRGFGSGERRAVGVSAELAEARREQAEAEAALREAKQSGDAEALQAAMDAADAAQEKIDEILAKGEAYVESLRKAIENQLSDYERDWIKATQELMDDYSKGRLNETTLEVYGIKKANVEHYFPIKSDRNFTRGNFEAVARDMSLENVGYMKERVGGTNPMYLMDVADVVNTQISNVAQYCGLMPAVRTFNKIWNKSEAGNTVSLKDTVNKKFGQGGLKYVENLIADLQGARRSKSSGLSRFLSGMRGNMAAANLTLSLNTALAQAASYPTAAAEIGWTPLIKAFAKGGRSDRMISRADQELIAKYTPLLWKRLQGFSTVELGDLAGNNQLAGRVFRKMRILTGWIQAMDTATVGRLWYAAQYYIDAQNPELQKGSDAYYRAVAKVFNDIVEKTQPDYTTMQRPDVLRDPSELVRSLTMFMTQRLQNMNIVYDAIATAQKYRQDYKSGQNGVTAEDVKQAQQSARRAVASQVVAGATIVVFKTVAGILQHALDGYRDEDKELTAESISLAILDMFCDTMASNVLIGGELYDVIETAITGNRYYGLEVNGVQSISDILSTSQSLFAMLRDPKNLNWEKVQPKFFTLAKKLGPMLGLPIGNAVKLCKGIWLWGQEVIHAAESGDMRKALDFEEGVERGAGIEAGRYVSAWLDRDREKMREIIGGLGVSMTSFNSQLSSEIRERYESGSVNRAQAIRMLQELRGKTPEQAEKIVGEWSFKADTGIEYDDIKEQLMNGEISVNRAAAYWQKYGGMSAEDATLKANYVAACGDTPGLADKLSQTQYKGWYNNVRSAGVKVEVYAEIRSTASTDGNSNVSQAEAAAAITRAINARQLTPAQAEAIWKSFNKSWTTTYADYVAKHK